MSQINITVSDEIPDDKLDKGTYSGTASDLVNLINQQSQNLTGVKEDLIDELNSRTYEGVEGVQLYTDLPTNPAPEDGVSKNVKNDPDSNKNGGYTVSNGVWVKDYSSNKNIIDKNNTTDGVTGSAVYELSYSLSFQNIKSQGYIFKGFVDNQTSTPEFSIDTAYISTVTGNVFGISVTKGDVIVSDKNNFYVLHNASFLDGGYFYLANSDSFVNQGYYRASDGVWVSSTAGYVTSGLLPVKEGLEVFFKLNVSPLVKGLTLFDVNQNELYTVSLSGETESSILIPQYCFYIRTANLSTATLYPYLKVIKTDLNNVLTVSDIHTTTPLNLADLSLIIPDLYVSSTGALFSGSGWKTIKIDVENITDITFGNISIESAGYSAFYSAGESIINYNGNYTNATLPKTYEVPEGAKWLYITIARPVNTETDYEKLMINSGGVLLDYESPKPKIKSIKGFDFVLNESTGIEEGSDASLGNLIVQSLVLELEDDVNNVDDGDTYIAEVNGVKYVAIK